MCPICELFVNFYSDSFNKKEGAKAKFISLSFKILNVNLLDGSIPFTESPDGFTQGFTRFANEPADFLYFVAQFLDRFNSLLAIRDFAISIETLV